MGASGSGGFSSLRRIALIFSLLMTVVALAGVFLLISFKKQLRVEKELELNALATTQARAIEAWRLDRQGDPILLARDPLLLEAGTANRAVRAEIRLVFSEMRRQHNYVSAAVFDTTGSVLVSDPAEVSVAGVRGMIAHAAALRKPYFSEAYLASKGETRIAVVVPVTGHRVAKEAPRLFVMIEADLGSSLFSLLTPWPLNTHTAESNLVARDGESVVFLTKLSGAPGSVVHFRQPLNREMLPAARAVSGFEGTMSGKDYLGIPVLAPIRRVQDSPWYVVTKMQESAVYAPLEVRAWLLLVVILSAAGASACYFVYAWRRNQARFFEQQYKTELEHKAIALHYEHLTRYASDAILLLNDRRQVVEANDCAVRLYGYAPGEFTALEARDLRSWEGLPDLEQHFLQAAEAGGARFETIHRRKGGASFPVECSLRAIRTESGLFYQDIVRDITEKKAQEKTILRLNRLYTLLARTNHIIVHSSDETDLYAALCRFAVEEGGFQAAMIHMAGEDGIARLVAQAGALPSGLPGVPAMRTGGVEIYNGIEADARMGPLGRPSVPGDRSLAACPLRRGGQIAGWATFIADAAGYFQEAEERLLNAIAADVSYALDAVATRRSKDAAVEALRESEALFHQLADSVPAFMWMVDAHQSCTLVNKPWLEFTGRPIEKELGSGWTEGIHPEDLGRCAQIYQSAYATRAIYEMEYRHRRYDGEYRWVLVRAAPHFMSGGVFAGYIGSNIDITERRAAEQRLRELSVATEQSPISVVITDTTGKIQYVNPKFTRVTGYSFDEVVGQNPRILKSGETRPETYREMWRKITSGEEWHGEFHNRKKDGELYWELACVAPIRNAAGAITQFVAVKEDITELKAQREAVKGALEAQQLALEAANAGTWRLDLVTSRLQLSHRSKLILGFSLDEEPTLDEFHARCHPADHERVRTSFAAAIAEDRVYDTEYRVNRPDGSLHWVLARGHSHLDPAGKPMEMFGVFIDIDERKNADRRLRQAEEDVRQITAAAQEGIFRLDARGCVTFANDRLAQILDRSVAEAVGRPAAEFVWQDDRPLVEEKLELRRAGVTDQYEIRLLRSDGSPVWVSQWGTPVFDDSGTYAGSLAMVSDISERKALETRLQYASKMEAIGRLAGGVAHDFNNLLTLVLGNSELLKQAVRAEPRLAELANQVIDAGERAARLTGRLLLFSQRHAAQPKLLKLNPVIREIEGTLERVVGAHVRIELDLDNVLPNIRADRMHLEQVLMNLALNAKEAMPSGGVIRIATGMRMPTTSAVPSEHFQANGTEYVCLRVSDTGRGMDAGTLAHLFEPFFTTKPLGQGSGLGLSTVYGIVAAANGLIEVNSQAEEGAEFLIYFPAVWSQSESETRHEPAVSGGSETVLVADDQPALRRMIVTFLRSAGYKVLDSADANEAIEIARTHPGPIDLLLTDVVMPEMNGRDLADCIVAIRAQTQVLFVSGFTSDVLGAEDATGRQVNLLEKPFTMEALCRKVREVLDSREYRSRVLVADDDAGIRKLMRVVLEQSNYYVDEAENGNALLRQVIAGEFDAVITDILMPDRDGLETIPLVRKCRPDMPIVVVSGGAEPLLHAAELLGAREVLMKPVRPEELLACLDRILRDLH